MQTTYTLKSNICGYTTTQAGGDDCTDDIFINHERGHRNLPSHLSIIITFLAATWKWLLPSACGLHQSQTSKHAINSAWLIITSMSPASSRYSLLYIVYAREMHTGVGIHVIRDERTGGLSHIASCGSTLLSSMFGTWGSIMSSRHYRNSRCVLPMENVFDCFFWII
jgi:hypothetical protein